MFGSRTTFCVGMLRRLLGVTYRAPARVPTRKRATPPFPVVAFCHCLSAVLNLLKGRGIVALMGIFDRVGSVISSNFNALLDQLEDPKKSVDQTLDAMREQVRAARREI